MKTFKNIDEYILNANLPCREWLQDVRNIVHTTVPEATEAISYGMPAFKWKGQPLFYFAAMKGHLGLYPTSGPIKTLQNDLIGFSTSKGCVRVPWTGKIPEEIIVKLLKERMKEIDLTQ